MIPPPASCSDAACWMGLGVPSILQACPHRLSSLGLAMSLVAQLLKAGSEVPLLSLACPCGRRGQPFLPEG